MGGVVVLPLASWASHTRMPDQAATLLTQLALNLPRKTVEDGPSTWSPANHVGDQMEFPNSASTRPSPGYH